MLVKPRTCCEIWMLWFDEVCYLYLWYTLKKLLQKRVQFLVTNIKQFKTD